jgi:hypothetical protein
MYICTQVPGEAAVVECRDPALALSALPHLAPDTPPSTTSSSSSAVAVGQEGEDGKKGPADSGSASPPLTVTVYEVVLEGFDPAPTLEEEDLR